MTSGEKGPEDKNNGLWDSIEQSGTTSDEEFGDVFTDLAERSGAPLPGDDDYDK